MSEKRRKARPVPDFVPMPVHAEPRSLLMLTREQWSAVGRTLSDAPLRDEAVMTLLYEAALRRSEIGLLRLESVKHLKNRILWVQRIKQRSKKIATEKKKPKAVKRSRIKLELSTVALLREWIVFCYPEENRSTKWFLFPGQSYLGVTKGLSPRTVYNIYNKYAAAARVPQKLRHPHVLRRTRAQHLLEYGAERGIDVGYLFQEIANLLGHSDARITIEHYLKTTQVTKEFLQEANRVLVTYYGDVDAAADEER